MKRITSFFFFLALAATMAVAQNITDLSVAGEPALQRQRQREGKAIADSVFRHPERIRYDSRCFQIEGEDVFIFSGTFHYFRTPQPLWADRFAKLKAMGLNCVETYVPWNWHEREMPTSPDDFSKIDMSELEAFLQMAEKHGLYVILRPGPYICAEWSGGGFPQWLMRKQPAKPTCETWLQSNDPEFMRWNEHWYKAVCQVAAPHQLSRKAKGGRGIILFQIENEFNRVKWISRSDKRDYLERLAVIARQGGIDVPLITCWTQEARLVDKGPLDGVLDMVNSYPRWEIEKNFGKLIDQQLKTQAGRPLLSGELQGGWMSEVGGRMSWEQEGLTPAQTQNITLYALQRGFCGINYYMAVGGTHFDDWGARGMTTTYDYAAAIGEDGSTNGRYERFRALAPFLKEHGTRIARAEEVELAYESTDADVRLALRQAANGDRYYFVRTEEHTREHRGRITTADGFALDFTLEPFGSVCYFLPAGASAGQLYPAPVANINEVKSEQEVELTEAEKPADKKSTKWRTIKTGEYLDSHGIYGRHFVHYLVNAPASSLLTVGRTGRRVVNGSRGDMVAACLGDSLLTIEGETDSTIVFRVPTASKKALEVRLTYLSAGLHHHTNSQVEAHWGIGIDYARAEGKDLPLRYSYTETPQFHYTFKTPAGKRLYHLNIDHTGDGYIYINDHCIGRCYEEGPQRDYYIPECWLNPAGKSNHIAISLCSPKATPIIKNIKLNTR